MTPLSCFVTAAQIQQTGTDAGQRADGPNHRIAVADWNAMTERSGFPPMAATRASQQNLPMPHGETLRRPRAGCGSTNP